MLRRFAGNAAALTAGGLLAQWAFISVEVAIARSLGSEQFGVFATVHAMALASLIITDMGMTWHAIESGAREPASIGPMLGTTLVLKTGLFALLYPLANALLPLLGYDQRACDFFSIFFIYSLSMAWQDSLSAAYTAHQRMAVTAICQGGAPLLIAALVFPTLASGGGLNGVAWCYVAGGFAVVLLWLGWAWPREQPSLRLRDSGRIFQQSYLYALTGLLVHLFRKGDILLLSLLAGMEQVGIYAAGAKLIDLAHKIPQLASLVVSPELFRKHESDELVFDRLADRFVRVNLLLGLLLGIVLFHSAPWLIALLFGDKFSAAAQVLRILSASFALKFLANGLQTVLTTGRQHGQRTGLLALATSTAVIGHCLLIPTLGAAGAAIAVVLAESLLVVLYLRAIESMRLRQTLNRSLLLAGLALVPSVMVPPLLGLAPGPVSALVALFVFVLLLPFTGFVTRVESRRLIGLLNHGLQGMRA